MARITHIALACAYSVACLFVCVMLIRFDVADVSSAWTISTVLGLVVAQIHVMIAREASRNGVAGQMRELTEAKRLMVEELAALRRRIGYLEEDVVDDGEERHAAIVAEMRTLEHLVENLGRRLESRSLDAFEDLEGGADAGQRDIGRRADGQKANGHRADGPVRDGDRRARAISNVREALSAGRVDLHLQPIVSLPQRKTFYYEGFSRLRDAEGQVIMPAEWLPVAEPAGLVAEIDNLLLFRCVQIVRKLAAHERRVGVFCNISNASLSDEEFFPQFLDFVRRNADLSGSLIFEIGQQAFENRSLTAARNMARLADFGFRFSIDKVVDLDFDLADARRAGVQFFKVPGELLLKSLAAGEPLGLSIAPEIRAEDFSALLAKYGIELIAEKIEDEATVVEVLDLQAGLAQGHLFGPPRPLKDGVIGEEAAPAPGPAPRGRLRAAG